MSNNFIFRRILILIIVSYAFFFLGNSIVALTDPDEVFYSLTAKEMAVHQQWLVPYIFDKPQFEKPIMTYWLLRAAFELWGYTPFAARFFPALFGCLGVLGCYVLGLLGFRHERKAFYSALILCSAGLFAGMGKTVFTDMIFTVFILLTMLSFYAAFVAPMLKKRGILLAYCFAALAVLTKGPLALTMMEMTVILYLLYVKRMDFLRTIWFPLGLVLCLAIALPWYVYMYQQYGQGFLHEFFYNDHIRRFLEAEHKGNDHWFFYPLTILLGFFPWTLFTASAFVDLFKRLKTGLQSFDYFLLSWILVVMITFQFAHSKLTSYILPLFPAVALLTGAYIVETLEKNGRSRLFKICLSVMAGFLIILGAALPLSFSLYKKYILDIGPIFFVSGVLLTMGILILIGLMRDHLLKSMIVLGLFPLALLWGAFLMKDDIQPFISTADTAPYIPQILEGRTILTSKPYARGVRYFTDENVTVLNINGGNYFSPHPIEILTTEKQLLDYLKKQSTTIAVLKKGGYKTIMELPPKDFKVNILKQIGYNYILKIEVLR